jgi:hypothetical protein
MLRLAVLGLALTSRISATVRAEDPPAPATEPPGMRESQVTLVIDRGREVGKFRATVMGKKGENLTILTAAHCLSPDDANSAIRLVLDGEAVEGTVVSAVRNPAFKPNHWREIPGPDNAVARLRFRPSEATPAASAAFEALKAAPGLTTRPYPGPAGQVVRVRMLDARGVEHAVKAGNYSNPRFLEWGPAYKPAPGDSGGGVFVLNNGADGKARPILIGVIVGYDDKGGAASLVSRDMRWIAEELTR